MTAPMPRLEFRWRTEPKDQNETDIKDRSFDPQTLRFCDYGLVMPLRELDIRAEVDGKHGVKDHMFHVFSTTAVSGGAPMPGDVPFRDGAHAKWDNEALGGHLETWCQDLDGTHTRINT